MARLLLSSKHMIAQGGNRHSQGLMYEAQSYSAMSRETMISLVLGMISHWRLFIFETATLLRLYRFVVITA